MGKLDYIELALAALGLSGAALAYLLSLPSLEFCAIVLAAVAFGVLLARRVPR